MKERGTLILFGIVPIYIIVDYICGLLLFLYDDAKCFGYTLQIKDKTDFLRIFFVKLCFCLYIDGIAAVDLRPSCEPRFTVVDMISISLGDQILFIAKRWTWPDKAHVSCGDIDELRELV